MTKILKYLVISKNIRKTSGYTSSNEFDINLNIKLLKI